MEPFLVVIPHGCLQNAICISFVLECTPEVHIFIMKHAEILLERSYQSFIARVVFLFISLEVKDEQSEYFHPASGVKRQRVSSLRRRVKIRKWLCGRACAGHFFLHSLDINVSLWQSRG